MKTVEKYSLTFLFFVYSFALIVRGLPTYCPLQKNWASHFDFWFEGLQFWQNWKMFAPDPAKDTYRIKASIKFSDGSLQEINWPWFPDLSFKERLRFARLGKWMENMVGDVSRSSWPSTALFIAKIASCDGQARNQLTDLWKDIPTYLHTSELCRSSKFPTEVILLRQWQDIQRPEYRMLTLPPKITPWQKMWAYKVDPKDYFKWGS